MKRIYFKKDKSIILELYGHGYYSDSLKYSKKDLLNGWVRILKDGKTMAVCSNFDEAIFCINRHLFQGKETITEKDFEGF